MILTKDTTLRKAESAQLGVDYHVSWANSACFWRCTKYLGNGKVELTASRSGKKIKVNESDLYHTRANTELLNKIK